MTAARAGAAGVVRRYDDETAAIPGELVLQLPPELVPALIEDRLVQAGLGPNVFPRRIYCACRRLGHIPHLQVLDTHYRVVFADRGRGLVQEIAAGVGDAGVDTLDACFRLLPVAAELDLAGERLLCLAQALLVPLEAVEGCVERAVAERSEPGNTHVDTNRATLRDSLLDLSLGLNGNKPLAAAQADGDVA
jgi:hypothetical protein